MAKLHIATDIAGTAPLMVERSLTTLKERLRQHPDSQWEIATYEVPADATTQARLVENAAAVISSLISENKHSVKVNAQGQVRAEK